MQITIQNDNNCWVCGRKGRNRNKITMHHTLPRHLKPRKNVIIPVCQKCHEKINTMDISGLYKYAFKIKQQQKELSAHVTRFFERVVDKKKYRRDEQT